MVVSILQSAIIIATIFLYGCLGETLMEKAGHLNLGIPGIMCLGTFGGCYGISLYMAGFADNPESARWFGLVVVAILFSALFSLLGGLIYAFLTVSLKCNQNVTGLALTIFGAGFADFFMSQINSDNFAAASRIIKAKLPFADSMIASENAFVSGVGSVIFGYGILVYLAIVAAIVLAIVLKRTRVGLSLRTVGESPATADAAGINVSLYKYCAILIGSVLAGLGGLTHIMQNTGGTWENSTTIQSFGWLSIALVIFCIWKPILAIGGSLIFGFLFILPSYVGGITPVEMKLMSVGPYIVTIIVLIITSIVGKKSVQPPSSLGLSYFREER